MIFIFSCFDTNEKKKQWVCRHKQEKKMGIFILFIYFSVYPVSRVCLVRKNTKETRKFAFIENVFIK